MLNSLDDWLHYIHQKIFCIDTDEELSDEMNGNGMDLAEKNGKVNGEVKHEVPKMVMWININMGQYKILTDLSVDLLKKMKKLPY